MDSEKPVPTIDTLVRQEKMRLAAERLHPENFGFAPYGKGFIKGDTVFTKVTWEAVQLAQNIPGHGRMNVADIVYSLQQQEWGEHDAVPTDVLGILEKTGGHLLAAYSREKGLTPEGWAGLAIGLGSNHGTVESHMVVVPKDKRGSGNVGWNMKMIQAHEAVQNGFDSVSWTYNPMQGLNANLNLEKLGGNVESFVINQYGQSPTFGNVPSHRFTVNWDLLDDRTHHRLQQVYSKAYRSPTVEDVASLPELTEETLAATLDAKPSHMTFSIPGDHTQLSLDEQIEWMDRLGRVFSDLLDTEQAVIPDGLATLDPALTYTQKKSGDYRITGLASSQTPTGRQNKYILERKTT